MRVAEVLRRVLPGLWYDPMVTIVRAVKSAGRRPEEGGLTVRFISTVTYRGEYYRYFLCRYFGPEGVVLGPWLPPDHQLREGDATPPGAAAAPR